MSFAPIPLPTTKLDRCRDCAGWDGGFDDLGPCLFLRQHVRRDAVERPCFVPDAFPAREGKPLAHITLTISSGHPVLEMVSRALSVAVAKIERGAR